MKNRAEDQELRHSNASIDVLKFIEYIKITCWKHSFRKCTKDMGHGAYTFANEYLYIKMSSNNIIRIMMCCVSQNSLYIIWKAMNIVFVFIESFFLKLIFWVKTEVVGLRKMIGIL